MAPPAAGRSPPWPAVGASPAVNRRVWRSEATKHDEYDVFSTVSHRQKIKICLGKYDA